MKNTYIATGSYNKSIALEYINGCIEQCDSLEKYNKTLGIMDFLTHIRMFELDEYSEMRKNLFNSYKKNYRKEKQS